MNLSMTCVHCVRKGFYKGTDKNLHLVRELCCIRVRFVDE